MYLGITNNIGDIEMNKQEVYERLLQLDEEASLMFDDNDKYFCVIVGGTALLLLGYISRATNDIDALECKPNKLLELLLPYDINTQVRAHIDCFPEDYRDRLVSVPIKTRKIEYYTLSLEDLVISKLLAGRSKDTFDLTGNEVIEALDWELLDRLAHEAELNLLNDRVLGEFRYAYNEYIGRYRKEIATDEGADV